MRAEFRSILPAAAICLALAAPASANHTSAWEDGGAGTPPSVEFEDVAVAGGVVIAAGGDSAAGAAAAGATIHRRAGDTWVADEVTGLPAGATDATVSGVAHGAGAAWGVGSYRAAGGAREPLVLRFASAGDLEAEAAGSWAPPPGALPAGLDAPRSVAMHGSRGLIGDADGEVFSFTDAAGVGASAIAPVTGAPGVAATGVAAYRSASAPPGVVLEGTAVTELPDSSPTRIHSISVGQDGPPSTPSTMVPATADSIDGGDLDAVAAVGPRTGLAVESGPAGASPPAFWTPDSASGTWERRTDTTIDAASQPSDVALADTGGGVAEAIAGKRGSQGAVWRRAAGGGWTRDDGVSPQPLNGVAIRSATDIWAVGAGGTVRHYTPQPDPPPPPLVPETKILSGPIGATGANSASFTFTAEPGAAGFECSLDGAAFSVCTSPASYDALAAGQHTFRVRALNELGQADPTPATRTFTVIEPGTGGSTGENGEPAPGPPADPPGDDDGGDDDPSREPCAGYPERLATDVNVKTAKKSLRFKFRLKRRARVQGLALRDARVVGRSKKQTMGRGAHKLVVRFRKKPTHARLDVDPPRACGDKRASAQRALNRQDQIEIEIEGSH